MLARLVFLLAGFALKLAGAQPQRRERSHHQFRVGGIGRRKIELYFAEFILNRADDLPLLFLLFGNQFRNAVDDGDGG